MVDSIKSLASKLEVSPATLMSWEKRMLLDIPRTSKGKLASPQEAEDLFKTIKSMRDGGSGFETIQKVVKPDQFQNRSESIPDRSTDQSEGQDKLLNALNEANQKVGQLQEALNNRDQLIESLQNQIKLLPEPDEWLKEKKNQAELEATIKAQEEQLKCLPSPEHWEATQAKIEALEAKPSMWKRFRAWLNSQN